jgi:hypothetical protein
MSMRGMARYWGVEWPSLRLKRRRACISRPAASFFGTKPFCRGDETVLKRESEYRPLIRLGRPKCNLSSISFGRSRAADTSLQWASRRPSGDRGFSSCSRGDQLRDLRCARAGCLSHWLAYRPWRGFCLWPHRGSSHGQTSQCRGH